MRSKKEASNKIKGTLVILTLNEIEGLTALYNKLPINQVDEVFAVDRYSTDGTLSFYKKHKIRVIMQKSKGRGVAFRLAVKNARNKNIVMFSPDGNEDPSDIVKIFKLLEEGNDMVIASRFMKGSRNDESGKLFRFRAWANQVFTILANIFFGGTLTDSINGYRGFTKEAFSKMKPDAKGFSIEFQLSIRAMKCGLRIAEIPTIEGDRIGGKSTAHSLPTGWELLKALLREIYIGKNF